METYATLLNLRVVIPSSKTSYVAVERDFWRDLFALRLASIDLDEAWYLERYPDIALSVRNGTLRSGRDHYIHAGFQEHRMPYQINVDSDWYLEQYPDIKAAVLNAIFVSAQDHFEESGFREGRFPFPNFSLRTVK